MSRGSPGEARCRAGSTPWTASCLSPNRSPLAAALVSKRSRSTLTLPSPASGRGDRAPGAGQRTSTPTRSSNTSSRCRARSWFDAHDSPGVIYDAAMELDPAPTHAPPSPPPRPSTPLLPAVPAPAARSVFVTVVAWVYLVNASFATYVLAFQLFLWHQLFSSWDFSSIAPPGSDAAQSMRWQSIIPQVVLSVLTALAVTMLAASIGVLHRKRWARRLFTWLLVAGIVVARSAHCGWSTPSRGRRWRCPSTPPSPPNGSRRTSSRSA